LKELINVPKDLQSGFEVGKALPDVFNPDTLIIGSEWFRRGVQAGRWKKGAEVLGNDILTLMCSVKLNKPFAPGFIDRLVTNATAAIGG